jgi:hypothetical protein
VSFTGPSSAPAVATPATSWSHEAKRPRPDATMTAIEDADQRDADPLEAELSC